MGLTTQPNVSCVLQAGNIGTCTALLVLNLEGCQVGVLGALRLSSALYPCVSMTDVRLGSNRLVAGGSGCLAKAFPFYQEVGPCGGFTRYSGKRLLHPAVPPLQMRLLDLHHNGIDCRAFEEHLFIALPRCRYLATLSLESNPMTPRGVCKLASALPDMQCLTSLNVRLLALLVNNVSRTDGHLSASYPLHRRLARYGNRTLRCPCPSFRHCVCVCLCLCLCCVSVSVSVSVLCVCVGVRVSTSVYVCADRSRHRGSRRVGVGVAVPVEPCVVPGARKRVRTRGGDGRRSGHGGGAHAVSHGARHGR